MNFLSIYHFLSSVTKKSIKILLTSSYYKCLQDARKSGLNNSVVSTNYYPVFQNDDYYIKHCHRLFPASSRRHFYKHFYNNLYILRVFICFMFSILCNKFYLSTKLIWFYYCKHFTCPGINVFCTVLSLHS